MPVTFGPARFRGNAARRARGRDAVDRFWRFLSPLSTVWHFRRSLSYPGQSI